MYINFYYDMNYKLEKFWNGEGQKKLAAAIAMNYKLEKFWNNGKAILLEEYV